MAEFTKGQRVRILIPGKGPTVRRLNGPEVISPGKEGVVTTGQFYAKGVPCRKVLVDSINNPPGGYIVQEMYLSPLDKPKNSLQSFREIMKKLGVKELRPAIERKFAKEREHG